MAVRTLREVITAAALIALLFAASCSSAIDEPRSSFNMGTGSLPGVVGTQGSWQSMPISDETVEVHALQVVR